MQPQQGEYLPVAGPTSDERTWAMLCHLCIIGQMFFPVLVVGPLLIWLIKGDQMPFVKEQGKEAINFQITLFLAGLVATALVFVLIGWLLLAVLWVYAIVAGVIATMKVKEGVPYRYGLNVRLVK
jgi:uncharacterized Tic20 family protein